MSMWLKMSRQRGGVSALPGAVALCGLVAVALVVLYGQASADKSAKVSLFPEYGLANPDSASLTKSDVTITVTPLGMSHLYEHPTLFSFDKKQIAEPIAGGINFGTYCEKDYEKRYWWYTFGSGDDYLAVFQVEVRNGTDHILRMKDARIYLELPEDEAATNMTGSPVDVSQPVAAVTKLGDSTLVPNPHPAMPVLPKSAVEGDGSLVHWVTYFEQEAEKKRPKKRFFDNQHTIPIGLASQVIAQNRTTYKLIADTAAEILPGRSLKGILLFPVLVSFENATLSFYEIHTKTDSAGDPIEKATFTFPLKLNRVQMQWDGEKEKRWKLVSAGEG